MTTHIPDYYRPYPDSPGFDEREPDYLDDLAVKEQIEQLLGDDDEQSN